MPFILVLNLTKAMLPPSRLFSNMLAGEGTFEIVQRKTKGQQLKGKIVS